MSSQSNQPNACEADDGAGGLHQRITDAVPHALAFVDAEGVYRAVNAACAELYGRTPAEMVGHAVEAFCPGDLCAGEVLSCLERCLAGEEVECETPITGDGRRRRRLAMRYCPSRDATGEVTGVIMHGMDITERKRAEKAACEREEDLRRAQRMAHLGSWRFDLDRGTVEAPDETRRIYGLGDRPLTIETAQSIPLPEYRAALDAALEGLVERGEPYDIEFEIERPSDGEIRHIHSIAQYDAARNLVIGTIQDVTDRRNLEERLRHMQKMEAIGQLAGGVAHDFNNQLAGIMGYAGMLRDALDDPALQGFADHIIAAARRSGDLTQKLLAFARKGQYETLPVDLHHVVDEVVGILKHSLDKRVELVQRLRAEPATTKGDATQLQNAVLNLALNAADAMPDGGELIFETNVVELDRAYCRGVPYEIAPGAYVRLSVTDSGVGIPPDCLERIFEPFFTTKEVGKGTGMGLAAVYGTIKQHDGAINVYSEVGHGTTIRLYLPLAGGGARPRECEDAVTPAPCEATILLVDDEEIIREVAEELLTGLGYRVKTKKHGKSGVEYFRKHSDEIDLVILDLVMPKMNGPAAYHAMKAIDPGVKVLLASGYSLNGTAQELLDEGVQGFLQKPFERAALSAAVARLLQPPD